MLFLCSEKLTLSVSLQTQKVTTFGDVKPLEASYIATSKESPLWCFLIASPETRYSVRNIRSRPLYLWEHRLHIAPTVLCTPRVSDSTPRTTTTVANERQLRLQIAGARGRISYYIVRCAVIDWPCGLMSFEPEHVLGEFFLPVSKSGFCVASLLFR